jgi:hypothetical protein
MAGGAADGRLNKTPERCQATALFGPRAGLLHTHHAQGMKTFGYPRDHLLARQAPPGSL